MAPQRGYLRTSGYYGRYAPRGGELKFFDTFDAATNVASTGTIMEPSLCLIPQGVTESNRVGRKCTIKSISGRLLCIKLSGATLSTQAASNLRIIVYLDKQCNGATAAVTDLLDTSVITTELLQFNNLANSGRFKTLYSKDIVMNSNAATGSGTSSSVDRFWKKFNIRCNIPVEFSSTTGAIGEIRSNNIGVLMVAGAGNPVVSVQAGYRVRFSDN